MQFKNRTQAGQLLSSKLIKFKGDHPIILGLPRGGVPVAFEVAKKLHSPLNVVISRKVGAPFQPELAVGAICESSTPFWNNELLETLQLAPEDLNASLQLELQKIQTYTKMFRDGRPLPSLKDKTVIVVDDGIATGATFLAALKYLKHHHPKKLIAAAPVSSLSAQHQILDQVDEFISLFTTDTLSSVGEWYDDFSQVSSEEVAQRLKDCHSDKSL